MAVNYNDERLTEVRNEEKAELNKNDADYGNRIAEADKFYDDAINDIGVQDKNGNWNKGSWADKQTQIQNDQTDFAIDKIEQQKEQAGKDYIKEQSGAYVDWQQQSNQYGANAEKVAAGGLANSGYSESSQVSMYNTYQNRVATARESYNLVVMNYNNNIKEAQLANNAALAEIALQALEKGLELSLQKLTHRDQLLSEQADRKLAIKQLYQNKWTDVLSQINTENALAEEIRQHNENIALEREKLKEQREQFYASLNAKNSGGSGGGSTSKTNKTNKTNSGKNVKGNGKNVNIVNVEKDLASSEGKSYPIDMDSVLDLGYGPISAANLAGKVEQGIIEEYVSGGKTKFRKVIK